MNFFKKRKNKNEKEKNESNDNFQEKKVIKYVRVNLKSLKITKGRSSKSIFFQKLINI